MAHPTAKGALSDPSVRKAMADFANQARKSKVKLTITDSTKKVLFSSATDPVAGGKRKRK